MFASLLYPQLPVTAAGGGACLSDFAMRAHREVRKGTDSLNESLGSLGNALECARKLGSTGDPLFRLPGHAARVSAIRLAKISRLTGMLLAWK